jgi:NifU-like protein
MGDVRNVYKEVSDRLVIRTQNVYQMDREDGTEHYSETLLAVVASFDNSGVPDGYNARSMVGKSKRGEIALQLFAIVDSATETFTHVGFRSRGCLAVTACASLVAKMITGKTLDQALAIKSEDVRDALDGIPADKLYTMYFATEAVRALVGDYLIHGGFSIEELDKRVPCEKYGIACLMCEHCSLRDGRIDVQFG